jgi:hypothetical protein
MVGGGRCSGERWWDVFGDGYILPGPLGVGVLASVSERDLVQGLWVDGRFDHGEA